MAKEMIDIGLDALEDLDIAGGDFTMQESTAQHQKQLILNNKGEFRQNPTIGVGVFSYFNDENRHELSRAVSIEFTRDGMEVAEIKLGKDGVLQSEAVYK